MRSQLSGALCLLSLLLHEPARGDEAYVVPKLFDGALIISRAEQLSSRQQLLLRAEFERQAATLITLGELKANPDTPADTNQADKSKTSSLDCLRSIDWQQTHVWDASADQSMDSLRSAWSDQLKQLSSGSCVWIDADRVATTSLWLQDELRAAIERGAVVCVESHAAVTQDRRPFPGNVDLLPFVHWVLAAESAESAPTSDPTAGGTTLSEQAIKRMIIEVPAGAWLRVGERELINLSETEVKPCRLIWPATVTYNQPVIESLPSRRVSDLVAARRALHERVEPRFPGDQVVESKLKAGSLVIVGGGGATSEIWNRFIELAGGADKASIVVLPTASPDPTDDGVEVQILRRLGVEQLHVLTQTRREDVSSQEYLNTLRSATGVWFGGGRQWRFVDAYWGTPAWEALKQVVERGGVIGGSSAGATIQGDLLVRGSPLGNQLMVCDGYRHGLGLLPGVAIDQHFRQRNRFDDLKSVVKRFPAITGIGIDEGTALVVQAPDRCEVLGAGSVWLSYAGKHETGSGEPTSDEPEKAADKKTIGRGFIERPSGSRFQLGQ